MWNRLLNSFVNRIERFRFGYTFFFSIVYLLAIFYNGYYGLSFDTNAIIIGYGVIAGKGIASYAIDSRFNSQPGYEPGQSTKPMNQTFNEKKNDTVILEKK